MTTSVTIRKGESEHNLRVVVQKTNAGPFGTEEHTLVDGQELTVLIWGGEPALGGSTITIYEVDKPVKTPDQEIAQQTDRIYPA